MYGNQFSFINQNQINSYHNSDNELDQSFLIDEMSNNMQIDNNESSYTVQGQDNQDSILSNYPKMIKQDIQLKQSKDFQNYLINDFSIRKKKKIQLYNRPKIDCPSLKASHKRSRILKQYISHRTKMKTQNLN